MGNNLPVRRGWTSKRWFETQNNEYHKFSPLSQNPPRNSTSATVTNFIHQNADQAVKNPNPSALEHIFQVTKSLGLCSDASKLFVEFAELCSTNQEISIQLGGEDSMTMPIQSCQLQEFMVILPKTTIVTSVKNGLWSSGGSKPADAKGEGHIIIKIPLSISDKEQEYYVLDMTSMQYGKATGRGIHGEPYFLGRETEWKDRMGKYCDKVEPRGPFEPLNSSKTEIERQLANSVIRRCARTVLDRWQNREEIPFCAYCGVAQRTFSHGERLLEPCLACGDNKNVWYCCNDHRQFDEQLHQLSCGN